MNNFISISPVIDYDINITDIQLIHRNDYHTNMRYSAYANGRMTYGLVYILDGKAGFYMENETITAVPGTIMFLPEKAKYTVEAFSREDFIHYTVNFGIQPDQALNGPLYSYITGDKIVTLNTKNNTMFESGFVRLLSIWNDKKSGFRLAAKAQLYTLISEFFNELSTSSLKRSELMRISPVKEYIDSNFDKQITITQLAKLCDLSETHMRRLFHDIYHISPIEYQIELRMMRAKDLLLSKMYTVSEVAELCGFTDSSYFGRLFKSNVGISPLKYKNTN